MKYFLIFLIILTGCDKYKEHSVEISEIPIEKIISDTIIIKQDFSIYDNSFVESEIENNFNYQYLESFTEIDTITLGNYLNLNISTKGQVNGKIDVFIKTSDSSYYFNWLKIRIYNKKYDNSFLIN